jgi:hypothetical protein
MPTAAKLAAAVIFAALAWWVSQMVKQFFPAGSNLGRFSEYNALIGAFIGWRVAGERARTTWPNAVAYGLTAALSMTFMALFLHCTVIMINQSFQKVYEGPGEALIDIVRMMVENSRLIAAPDVIGTLLVGGIIGGLATEWVARNYR